jgi:hypothetical protein
MTDEPISESWLRKRVWPRFARVRKEHRRIYLANHSLGRPPDRVASDVQHALEALRNPRIRNGFAMSSFFHQIGPEGSRRFETPEADRMGSAVAREACRKS